LVVRYTDGISESTDPSGKQLDKEGLLALARGVPFASFVEAGEALLARERVRLQAMKECYSAPHR
jgi:hypothetical protein